MDSPYRSTTLPTAAPTPRDSGIVGEIIGQFADRYAFYRELVQNAIDAGTAAIDVTVQYDAPAELVQVTVRDHGEGMTRDVIENRLLVLFRSTKENDDKKIGKFGIGFASVLAINPKVVRVDSVRDRARNVLHLYPDLSYELFDGGSATKAGTTVELDIPLPANELDDFVTSSWSALDRWCKHATVPIHFTHKDKRGEDLLAERIDRPLRLHDAIVQVEGTSRDQHTRAVVGVLPDASAYSGFFNYGLTLYESEEPFIGRLGFKIQDPRLGHTLSRDNVRRDRSFERALEFARRLVDNALPREAARALRAAAESDDRRSFLRLVHALGQARVLIDRDQLYLPLLVPINGRRSTTAGELAKAGAWAAGEPGPVVAHLANTGTPVLDLCKDVTNANMPSLLAMVGEACGKRPRIVDLELTLAIPATLSSVDSMLIDELNAVLDHAYRRPAAIAMADLHGRLGSELSVAAKADDIDEGVPWLLERDAAERNPFSLLRRLPLVLNTSSRHVESARERAANDPVHAAALLARMLLLQRDALDGERSEKLLELSLDQLVGGHG